MKLTFALSVLVGVVSAQTTLVPLYGQCMSTIILPLVPKTSDASQAADSTGLVVQNVHQAECVPM